MTPRKRDPIIQREPFDKITIFEVTAAERHALADGEFASLFLNLGIAAISVALSFLVVLLAAGFNDLRTFIVFVVVTVIGFLAGVTFLGLWWQRRRLLHRVITGIRRRKPPGDGVQRGHEPGAAPNRN